MSGLFPVAGRPEVPTGLVRPAAAPAKPAGLTGLEAGLVPTGDTMLTVVANELCRLAGGQTYFPTT